jgi:preprotein translocase subunit SecG
MSTFVTVVHIITCVLLILVVLIQSGKGAEISASLGGSSQTVFGSSGGANFFTRFTSAMATIFFVTSLGLTILNAQARKSVFEGAAMPPAQGAPATAPAQPAAPAQSAPVQQQAPAQQGNAGTQTR